MDTLVSRIPSRIVSKIKFGATDDECWIWTGVCTKDGYGRITIDGKQKSAHRVVYELTVGPIPEGLELDHLCMVTGCVSPFHLEPVTRSVNMSRARKARAWPKGFEKKELPRYVYRTSYGNRFFSQIRSRGKLHYLGTFGTPEEASEVAEATKNYLRDMD